MNAAAMLERLEKVKPTGPGRWIACCPSHDDKSPSLSIRETEDGKILLHDFAGCSASDVVAALGLSLSDLFPDKLEHVKPTRSRVPLRDMVAMLDHEALVIQAVASDFLNCRPFSDSDLERVSLAVERIGRVRDELT